MLEYFHILQKAIFEMNRTFWTMKCEETQVSPENGIYNRKQESKKTRNQESKNSTKKPIKKKRKQERKQDLDQESNQENKKTRSRPRKK